MKKILLIASLVVISFQFKQWFTCHELKNIYHFSVYELQIILDDLIHNDTGLPFVLIRAYHNKITNSAIEVFKSYISYWDIKFLVNLLLPVGLFGLIWTFLYGMKNKFVLFLTALALLLPFFEIFFKPAIYFPIKITLLALPLTTLSLFGLTIFLKQNDKKTSYLVVGVFLLWSIWWQFVGSAEIGNFCRL